MWLLNVKFYILELLEKVPNFGLYKNNILVNQLIRN